ncbi:MAG: tetratricopeptide repeat protein [PVC group bacterium]|nr:tetratricopeptide repeat protein [PVC group bacterium]
MKSIKVIIFILLTVMLIPGFLRAQTAGDTPTLKAEYEKLSKEYEAMAKDRDNLRAQTKILLKYKSQIVKAEEQTNKIDIERSQWQIEKKVLRHENEKLKGEISQLNGMVEMTEKYRMQLEEEKDKIRKSLSKSKSGYIIVEDLKRKVSNEKKEKNYLKKEAVRFRSKIKKLDNSLAKAETVEEVLRDQITELKEKYKEAQRSNELLEKKLNEEPKRYAEVARENKVLLKRTALMHYNLGVFYTKNKEYPRAISEFEKAIELNPKDTYAYFNLGYIYSEYYVDRPKAIENFRKYLSLAKQEDNDVDWVKRYILTWQTWEGKEVIK